MPPRRRHKRRIDRPLVLTSTDEAAKSFGPGHSPRTDFVELSRRLDAELVYRSSYSGVRALPERLTRLDWRQAVSARRRTPSAFLSLAEGVGIPLALLDQGRTPHVLVAHNSMRKRLRAYDRLGRYLRRVDTVIVLSRSHRQFLIDHAKVAPDRAVFVHDKVDHGFWRPEDGDDDGYVLSVGQEQRDYATLLDAVSSLGVRTVIVPGSLWWPGAELPRRPPEVELRSGLSYEELRALYDRAALVVVPLQPGIRYAAGVNAVLEGMAMGKAVVATATPGIADYVDDGVNGRLVSPSGPEPLRHAVASLVGDRAEAKRLGSNARALVEEDRNLDTYVEAIAAAVMRLVEGASARAMSSTG